MIIRPQPNKYLLNRARSRIVRKRFQYWWVNRQAQKAFLEMMSKNNITVDDLLKARQSL